MSDEPQGLDLLLAEREIHRVLTTYTRGNDRHDWAAVRTCFHPDARDDHLDYKGDIDGLIEWLADRHASLEHSVHHLGNVHITFIDGRTANVESYVIVIQRTRQAGALADVTVCSRYLDRFERREDRWLIADRTVAYGLSRVDPVTGGLEEGAGAVQSWVTAAFGADDPLFARLGEHFVS